jgi:hypothetical protein
LAAAALVLAVQQAEDLSVILQVRFLVNRTERDSVTRLHVGPVEVKTLSTIFGLFKTI